MWMNILSVEIGQKTWCTSGYYAWKVEGGTITRPSWERILGLVDYGMVCQVARKILPHMYLTTSMYRQVVLGSMDCMIPPDDNDDVREGTNEELGDQSVRNEDSSDYPKWLINNQDFMDYFLCPGDDDDDGPTWP